MNPYALHCFYPLNRLLAAIALCATALTLCGFGPTRPAYLGAGSLGRADATIATGMNVEALAGNPAGIKRGKGQAFELGYVRNPVGKGNNFFISSADTSSPTGIGGGGALSYESGKLADGGEFSRTENLLLLGAAARSQAATVMVGVAARRLNLTLKPDGSAQTEHQGWTGDLGLAMDLVGGVMIGVALRNVMDVTGIETPRRLSGGIGYGAKKFILEGSGSWAVNGEQPVYRAGLLVPLGQIAALRAGYVHDNFAELKRSVAAGGSLVLGRTRLDVGAQVSLEKERDVQFGVSLVYFVPYAM